MNTAEILQQMLVEEVGTAIGDSGGYPQYDAEGKYVGSSCGYGRYFERNRGRDFASEPETVLRFYHGREPGQWGMDLTVSTYHWLLHRLEYAENLDQNFHKFANRKVRAEDSWGDNYGDWLESLGNIVAPYEGPQGCNTYNYDCLLSQTLQFEMFSIDGGKRFEHGDYVWLQIHGGCDVRGGYTAPRLFKLNGYMEWAMFDFARATIRPDLSTATVAEADRNQLSLPGMEKYELSWDDLYWDTDDGYHWYCAGFISPTCALEELLATDDPEERGKGRIYIDEDGNGYCAFTGAKLEAYIY